LECSLDGLFAEQRVLLLCQLDLNAHSPPAIHTALRSHPYVVLDDRLRSNPYYEAPRILANEPYLYASTADAAQVTQMLASLRP
jgi:hypothetical protein